MKIDVATRLTKEKTTHPPIHIDRANTNDQRLKETAENLRKPSAVVQDASADVA